MFTSLMSQKEILMIQHDHYLQSPHPHRQTAKLNRKYLFCMKYINKMAQRNFLFEDGSEQQE